MTQQEIEALAMTGASTIVAAMATDAWSSARQRAAAFFHRHGPRRASGIEEQLDANAALVAKAADSERARAALVGVWQLELEALLSGRDGAAAELRDVMAHIEAALTPAQQQWVQHNTAHDRSVLNAVQNGTQNIHYAKTASAADKE